MSVLYRLLPRPSHVSWEERSNGANLAGGVWAMDHGDLLIAFWYGEKAVGVRGTGDMVDDPRDVGELLDTRERGRLGGISCPK